MYTPEVVVLGAGLMGRVAAYFFVHHPRPRSIRLLDGHRAQLDPAVAWLNSPLVEPQLGDVKEDAVLLKALKGAKVCISCVPYFLSPRIAKMCLKEGVSFLDLGGNPDVTDDVLALHDPALDKQICFIPDTGLAPGLGNILAVELVNRFQTCDRVQIRVGGLPQQPTGSLKYAQFFSVHGLLNEYLEDARELRDGKEVAVPSLSDLEELYFEGIGELEAFVTSGGTSTLPKTLLGKVNRLNYKTIRFPGHCAILRTLREIGLTNSKSITVGDVHVSPRDVLTKVLDNYLEKNAPDMVLLRVTATGDGGKGESIQMIVKEDTPRKLSAMGQTTAFPAAAIGLAILEGRVPPGAHAQETVIPFAWMKEQLGLFGLEIE
ncbi:saccharopine dehydrogenase NADP-binding domain-containing protein [candidate division KSB1 bacterium]|nr:saccharopine dehydrogenase NADP-binding domain-containing protein [candidate division KSB1 bacterium]